MYYGDALAGQGRLSDAVRAYSFYEGPREETGSWIFQGRARQASDAARRGVRVVASGTRGAEDWARIAGAYSTIGSYDRSAMAIRNLIRLRPSPDFYVSLALVENSLFHYATSAAILGKVVEAEGGFRFRTSLARELLAKQDVEHARTVVSGILAVEPGNKEALDLAADIERL